MSTGLFSTPTSQGIGARAHQRRVRKQNLAEWHQDRRDTKSELVAKFAEHLSGDGDVQRASKAVGISWPYGRTIFARIKTELGWQAK